MAVTKILDPVSRIEGHLKVEVTIDTVNGQQQVVDAKMSGTLFRGFEKILAGRSPHDAIYITQRICGVCPVSHAYAASLAVDGALKATVPSLGRVLRNTVLAANFVQSHILHFYSLALLDFVDVTATALWTHPWGPTSLSDLRIKGTDAATFVGHYVQALEMRRQAHQLGALFAGKLPHPTGFVSGGFTYTPPADAVTQANAIVSTLSNFVNTIWAPDVDAVTAAYSDYQTIGAGSRNLLAFGAFDLNDAGSSKLLPRGRAVGASTSVQSVDTTKIIENVKSSWYSDASLNPASGATTPNYGKSGAYSWLKAPRYEGGVYEVGPLARMWVQGGHRRGISVMDRHAARYKEAQLLLTNLKSWLTTIGQGGARFTAPPTATSGTGAGLVEAPRGALGHWTNLSGGTIANYQVITPTCWNASPRDDAGKMGAIEQALIGTPVADPDQPTEVLRVIHSFDPCLDCATHVIQRRA